MAESVRNGQELDAQQSSLFYSEVSLALTNFYAKTGRGLTAGSPDTITFLHEGIDTSPIDNQLAQEIRETAREAATIIERNNEMSLILYGSPNAASPYKEVRERKEKLKGATELLLGFCVDGRIKSILFGLIVNCWEVPAGEIVVQRREDGSLVPASPELRAGLSGFARQGKEILEIFFAHFDSTHGDHGCAANALILQALNTTEADVEQANTPQEQLRIVELLEMKRQRENILPVDVINQIKRAKSAEEANLILLEGKSIEAITNFYNSERARLMLQSLDIVGIAALYDTATKGITFNPLKENEQDRLSTTKLMENYKDLIGAIVQNFAYFGKYAGEDSITPDNYLEFAQEHSYITALLLSPDVPLMFGDADSSGMQNQFLSEIYNYVDQQFKQVKAGKEIDLTPTQKQALRFQIAKTVALQFLKGGNGAAFHDEGYMGVAIGSEFMGKFDTKQMFGSSPADIPTLLKQIQIELSVMRISRPEIKRPIVFASTSVKRDVVLKNSNGQSKAYDSAVADNLRVYDAIRREPTLANEVTVIGVLIDEDTREVLQVLDHSSSI